MRGSEAAGSCKRGPNIRRGRGEKGDNAVELRGAFQGCGELESNVCVAVCEDHVHAVQRRPRRGGEVGRRGRGRRAVRVEHARHGVSAHECVAAISEQRVALDREQHAHLGAIPDATLWGGGGGVREIE
jgi:hypothetical protein